MTTVIQRYGKCGIIQDQYIGKIKKVHRPLDASSSIEKTIIVNDKASVITHLKNIQTLT